MVFRKKSQVIDFIRAFTCEPGVGSTRTESLISSEKLQEICNNDVTGQYDQFQQGFHRCTQVTQLVVTTMIHFLQEFFGNQLVSTGIWPSRSPDLTPLKFFLWGNFRTKGFQTPCPDLPILRAQITKEIQKVWPLTLHRVFRNLTQLFVRIIEPFVFIIC